MTIRGINTDLKNSLIPSHADYKEGFLYAHLVKFEKSIKTKTGKSTKRALSYAYITDGSTDLLFNDGSVDEEGNANGTQRYVANKLLSVGSVSETVQARASSINLEIDTIALGTIVSVDQAVYTSSSVTGDKDFAEQGFREGDKIKVSVSTAFNQGKTFRIDRFSNENKTIHFSSEDTFTAGTGSGTETFEFASEEVIGLLNKKDSGSYAGYINREVFIYKAHIDPDDGSIIGAPYLLFKGIISSAKLTEDPQKNSRISWGISSHWGDFVRVNGRITSDSFHRGLDGNGISDKSALKRQAYAGDLGFLHSEQAINIIAIYQVQETRQKMKMKRKWYGSKKYKLVEYQVEVDREADLRFNLEAKYLPVVYGVQKIDSIPIFVDTLKNDANEVFVAYALCEGEIGGLYDIYFDDQSSICIDEQDNETRSTQTTEETIDVLCSGRMDRGDTLNNRTNVYNTNPTRLQGLGRGYGGSRWKRDGVDYEVDPVDANLALINTAALTPQTTGTSSVKVGLQHEEVTTFQKPIDVSFVFHSGKENQKADGLLANYAKNNSFKVQTDYFESTSEYWGQNHRLLDTAYVVAHYTISDGETQIPELDFVVRGKLLDCYNYDFSYVSVPDVVSPPDDIANFKIGDSVEIYDTNTDTLISSNNYVADIFTLPEENTPRIRLQNDPVLGSTTEFYIKKTGTSHLWHVITHDHIANEGSVSQTIKEEVTNASSTGTTTGISVDLNALGNFYQFLLAAGGNLSFAGIDITLTEADYIELARLTADITYETSGGGTIDNAGENTNTTEFDSAVSFAYITDAISLDSSASSVDDAYNGYTIELTRILEDGSFYRQQRTITDYDGTLKIAKVSSNWDAAYIPIGNENGGTADTYKILSKKDRRVSINPAIQMLDYLCDDRYGRDLSIKDDINLNSFKAAALECDTRSDITVFQVPNITDAFGQPGDSGDVYKFVDSTGVLRFQGTVSNIEAIVVNSVGYHQVTFTNVIGKLANKWLDWKSYQVGELVWKDGNLYEKTGSAGTIPSNFASGVSAVSTVIFDRVSGSDGTASVEIDIAGPGEATFDGDPITRKYNSSISKFVSGYSLYDSDDVKYWKYLGWDSQNQRHVTRHQTNTVLDTSSSIFDNINSMLNHFNGILRYSNGKYELEVETKEGTFDPIEQLTEEDIIGSINIEDSGQKGTFNTVSVGISDPQNRFESRSISFFDSNYLVEDRNISKKGDFKTPYVTNYFNARINARQYLEQSRYGLKISFKTAPKGLLLVAGSLIQLSYPRFGWSFKTFRITNLSFDTDCLVQVTAEEHNDSAYLIKAIPRQSYISENTTTANDPAPVAPTNLQTAVTSKGAINLSWTNSSTYNPANYEVEIYRSLQNSFSGSPAPELIAVTKGNTYSDVLITTTQVTVYYWIRYAVTTSNAKRTKANKPRQIFSTYLPVITDPGVSGTTSGSIDGSTILVSPGSVSIPEDPLNLGSYLYGNTGTTVRVKVGTVDIPYDDASPYGEPSFRLGTITGTGVTPGGVSTSGVDYVILGPMSSLTQQFASIEYQIIVVNSLGEETTYTIVQTVAASGVGSRGPGRWNVPVSSLPISALQAANAWDASWANRPGDAVENDQAWFYTGTESAPTGQNVWIYDGSAWSEQTEVIDGSLLIDETVGTDQLGSNSITTTKITTGSVVSGSLSANAVNGFALASGAVAAENIVANAITTDKLAASAITADKIDANSITADKIAANSINADKIAANSINTDELSANSVTTNSLAANSVVTDTLAANSVTTNSLAANSVVTDTLAANSITTNELAANSVTSKVISANSIDANNIISESITTQLLAANAVVADKLAASSVVATSIVAGSVVTDKLAANAITTDKIAANAVTTNSLAANSVNTDVLASNSVIADTLAASSVVATSIVAGSVETDKLAASAITADKMAANSINSINISACSITTEKLVAEVVTTEKIAANAITANKIAANAVTTNSLAANIVTTDKLQASSVVAETLQANSVTANKIVANAVNANKIAANSITANQLAANSVNANSIAANSITSDMVTANSIVATLIDAASVTANDITTSTIAALSANLGDITAGTLKGGSIPDANAGPSGSESGAFLDLSAGKMVFGDSSKYVLFDGTDLILSGVVIDANSIVNTSSKLKVQNSGGTAVEVDDLNFGTNLDVTVAGTSPIVATINALSDSQIRGLLSGSSGIVYNSGTGDFSLNSSIPGDKTFNNNVTVSGNLTVSGNTTTVNSNTVNIGDAIITLNSDETGAPSQNAGIEIERGTSTNKSLVWDETNDKWSVGGDTFVAGTFEGNISSSNIVGTTTPGNFGSLTTDQLTEGTTNLYYTTTRANSAIDGRVTTSFVNALNVNSTTLDNLDSASFLRSDAADTYSDIRASGSTNTGRFIGNSSWGTTHYTDNGYIQFGPANSSYAHIYTDRGNFYFNVTALYANGNTMWHAGNDGTGSGLDADTLDSLDSGSFLRSDAADSASGKITFTAPANDLIEVNTSASSPYLRFMTSSTNNGYIQFTTSDSFFWNDRIGRGIRLSASTYPEFYNGAYQTIWHSGNDASGSGLDADLLDGEHGSYYQPASTAITTSTTQASNLYIRGTSPTIYLRDTDHISTMIHQNSNLFYLLRADAADDITWTTHAAGAANNAAGRWPIEINVTDAGNYVRFASSSMLAGGYTVWHSGNDGSGTGLDADTLDSYQPDTAATANTIALRDGSANFYANYILGTYFNAASGNSENPTIGQIWTQSTGDNYLRKSTPAHFISQLSLLTTSGKAADSNLLDGLDLHTGRNDEANKVVRTDGSGYIQAGWINTTSGDLGTTLPDRVYTSNDGYIRYADLASFRARMNVTAKTGYQGRESSTTDTNYWIGSMGWGAVNMDTLFDYGSGSIDVSGNPANQPSGTSHWVGSQHLHYSNVTNRYGQQIVVGAGNPALMYVRGVWGGAFTAWSKIWNAANDGAGSGLDADLLDGYQSDTAATASTIALRDGNGDITQRYGFAQYFNMSHGASGATGDTVFYSSTDNYIRKNNATGFRASLDVPTRTGGNASGTWAISITGNAATATTAGNGGVTSVNGATGAVTVSTGNTYYAGTGLTLTGTTFSLTNNATGNWFVNNLTANTISADYITANTITATQMSANSITANELQISNSTGTSSGIFIDGATNSIKIYDGTTLRVKIGNL